ncbi:hypothetical protein QWZ08_07850 [Ferruginibacter paludis]|uniref:hypothetical protein n=1 Tax=Ferruginibacter paludis TaxID=1310417 RepID=UPI0025B3E4D8|nr:hypothetical protein [Ferruginibacter paludis]MDN3655534.1 hypothetical protein [Ferruginibacter paludis]
MENKYEFFSLEDLVKDGKDLKMKINTSFETIESLVDSLKNEVKKLNPSSLFLETVCYDLISRLPLPLHKYDDTFVLRARENISNLFTTKSEISYNSTKPEVISLGRFNRANEAMFYCTAPISGPNVNGALTTITETCKEIFDEESNWQHKSFTIGKWIVQKHIKLVALAFFDEALKKSVHMRNIIYHFDQFLDSAFNEEDQVKCRMFYGYFSQCAGKVNDTDSNYLLTNAFYFAIRKYYGEETGILYSSATTENHGINIVLTKEIVDSGYLKLDAVVLYEIIKSSSNFYNISCMPLMQSLVDQNGNFELKNIIDQSLIT